MREVLQRGGEKNTRKGAREGEEKKGALEEWEDGNGGCLDFGRLVVLPSLLDLSHQVFLCHLGRIVNAITEDEKYHQRWRYCFTLPKR